MTLPQQTWTYPALPQAAASPCDPAALLAALKAALDAWTDGHWEADQYTAGSRLTIRRKGAPAGVLGSFRAILFGMPPGGPGPDQAALAGNNGTVLPPYGGYLYCGVAEDVGAAVPTDPATGAPWSLTTTKYTGGVSVGNFGAGAWNNEAAISLFSCDRMLGIMIHNTQGTWSWTVLGEIVERASTGEGIWGVVSSSQLSAAADMTLTQGSPIPSSDGWTCFGVYYDGTQKRLVRSNGVLAYSVSPLESADGAGILCPIVMATGQMNDPNARQMIGTLRQMRMGPYSTGRKLVRDVSSTAVAIALNGAPTTTSSGFYLDQRV